MYMGKQHMADACAPTTHVGKLIEFQVLTFVGPTLVPAVSSIGEMNW